MNKKKPKEHYQVIITSGTDARKKPVSFSLSRKTIVIVITVFFLVIAVSLVISFSAFGQTSKSQKQIEDLTQKIEGQSKLLEEYAAQITGMQTSLQSEKSRTVSIPVSKSPSVPAISGTVNAQSDNAAQFIDAADDVKAQILNSETLTNLVWPFQDPGSGYDDWPGPDGYYHASRDDGDIHEGVDICALHGTPISAVSSGTVISNGWNNDGGWMVEIRSDEGYVFRYLHLAEQSSLTPGTNVQAGATIIGYCGNTGGDYPNHLHLSIYLPDSTETIDPTSYLKAAEERFVSGD